MIRTDDQRTGRIDYRYDPLGRILQTANERFAFDPAHNISDDGQTIMGNRLMEYNGVRYRYDGLGNLTERHSHTESQFYRYDADNQLIEARIEKANLPTQYWQYRYDPFGRRISKTNAKTQQSTLFVWEGSRLLQELRQDKVYTYVYTEQNSYEPLAQIETFGQPEKLNTPIIRYFHTDQIGIPREMTDEEGNIVWRGQYSGWGKLLHEEKANNHIHQPFRLQNQYADEETGLHYNFFRYYDAHCGRFTQQDPIGLIGGDNLYMFAPNVQKWVDLLGLKCVRNEHECGSNTTHKSKSCSQLSKEINELLYRDKHNFGGDGTHGLMHRFKEQINGRNGPGTQSWINHENQICGQQKGLRCRLYAYMSNGCGGPPPNAWHYATRPVPEASEWNDPSKNAKVVAGSVATIGGAYLLYRGVRMLPSLAPPLWPMIPANLALP